MGKLLAPAAPLPRLPSVPDCGVSSVENVATDALGEFNGAGKVGVATVVVGAAQRAVAFPSSLPVLPTFLAS